MPPRSRGYADPVPAGSRVSRADVDEGLRRACAAARAMVEGNEAVTIRIEIVTAPRTLAEVSVAVSGAGSGKSLDLFRPRR